MSLVKKSVYTSLTKALNILLSFLVQIILTPIILNGLGQQLFGVYSLINRIQGYLSLADLRPSAILRFKLSKLQDTNINANNEKKSLVGATLLISLISVPVMIFLGYIFSLYFHKIFDVEKQYIEIVQYSIFIFSIFIAMKTFLAIPESIVRGNNLEYKLFWIDPVRVIIYMLLVYYLLQLNYGLLGVIYSIIIAAMVDFLLKFILQLYYCPGYLPVVPKFEKLKSFFKSSTWYMGSSFNQQIYNSYELILIGYMYGLKQVTIYTLSRAILVRVSESVTTVVSGITASVGKLVGDENFDSLKKIRMLLIKINLLLSLLIFSYFFIFNGAFISLWVGEEIFIGNLINLVFCLTGMTILFTMTNDIFLNSFELYSKKTRVLFISVIIGIMSSLFFSYYFSLLGVAIGFLCSKIFQMIYYEFTINKFIKLSFKEILKKELRIVLFIIFYIPFSIYVGISYNIRFDGFLMFILGSILFTFVYFLIVYIILLKKIEKDTITKYILRFIKNEKNSCCR